VADLALLCFSTLAAAQMLNNKEKIDYFISQVFDELK
jgi:hypothetical protein